MSEVPAPYGVGASPAQTLPIPVILAHPAYQEFKRDLLTFILEVCERDGFFNDVGPESYNRFLSLSDQTMKNIMVLIMRQFPVFRSYGQPGGLFGKVDTVLKLMALGVMVIDDKYKFGFVRPVGTLPDPEMLRRIHARIAAVERLMVPALNRVALDVARLN